jgi:putative flippase GtrA
VAGPPAAPGPLRGSRRYLCRAELLGLALLVRLGVEQHVANALAFLFSTQVNFALSAALTWRDRLDTTGRPTAVARRLAGYNAMALGTLVANQAVFVLALPAAHYLAASALGILAGMLINYTVSGRVIFRPRSVLSAES